MPTNNKRSFDDLTKDELIAELEKRDAIIAKLKKAKTITPDSENVDPAKVAAKAEKLKTMASQQIKRQMKWKPSCKHGTSRFSWSGISDEHTFRSFMGLSPKDKVKGGRLSIEKFENLVGKEITASIRYGHLRLKGETVNITYKQADNEIKITGGYGL
jgi:DUF438 domain-containing protein